MPVDNVDIKKILLTGADNLDKKSREEEAKRVGTLRAGNTGLLSDDVFAGQCPRVAYLRYLGLVTEDKAARLFMFEGGKRNEDTWNILLSASWQGVIKREDECAIKWTTRNGTTVTGRPDIVLFKEDGTTAEVGLELKRVSSVWTALNAVMAGKPKLTHLTQAGHYSWKIGAPFQLWYTSDVDWHPSKFQENKCPKPGTKGGQYVDWNISKKSGNMWPKKVLPFVWGYPTMWNDKDELIYQEEGGGDEWEVSIITKKRIEDFYEFVSTMTDERKLGRRPIGLEADGQEGSYGPCDYCGLKPVCDAHEDDFSAWESACRSIAANLSQSKAKGE